MKANKFFFLLALANFTSMSFGAPKIKRIQEDRKGSLEFDRTLFDFGRIKRGETVKASFPFRNVGQGPITILGVQTPCGCTIVKFDRGRIYKPGESHSLEVTFDSSDFEGPVVKPIIAITNENRLPNRTLTLSGHVESEVIVDPVVLDFREIKAGQTATREVMIDPVSKQTKLSIEKKSLDNAHLDVSLDKNGEKYTAKVTLKESAPAGFFEHTIVLKIAGIKLSQIKIPVRADIIGPVSLATRSVNFGTVQPKEFVEKEVSVKAPDATKIWFEKAQLYLNGEPQKDTKDWLDVAGDSVKSLKIRLKNPGDFEGSVHGRIFFNTSDAIQKELSLDFFGLIVKNERK